MDVVNVIAAQSDLVSGLPVQPVIVQARDGRVVEPENLAAKAGPGASELTKRMLARAGKTGD